MFINVHDGFTLGMLAIGSIILLAAYLAFFGDVEEEKPSKRKRFVK